MKRAKPRQHFRTIMTKKGKKRILVNKGVKHRMKVKRRRPSPLKGKKQEIEVSKEEQKYQKSISSDKWFWNNLTPEEKQKIKLIVKEEKGKERKQKTFRKQMEKKRKKDFIEIDGELIPISNPYAKNYGFLEIPNELSIKERQKLIYDEIGRTKKEALQLARLSKKVEKEKEVVLRKG